MSLNKSKGNMYGFVRNTINFIKGQCSNKRLDGTGIGCTYCFMKRWGEQPELHFDESEMMTDLSTGDFVFVGSSCDMWADSIPKEWIIKILERCRQFEDNIYLFQTKNPKRFPEFADYFPKNTVLGITLETNRDNEFTCGQPPKERADSFKYSKQGIQKMVTCEPVMDFDLQEMVDLICQTRPDWVNIGADSDPKTNKLPEPPKQKIFDLILSLTRLGIKVKRKPDLERLLNG